MINGFDDCFVGSTDPFVKVKVMEAMGNVENQGVKVTEKGCVGDICCVLIESTLQVGNEETVIKFLLCSCVKCCGGGHRLIFERIVR
jgi:hypothetical protein